MKSNYHAEENKEFSNSELTILRRLYEMEKEDRVNGYTYGAVVHYAKKNGFFDLWCEFKERAGRLYLNGGPKDLNACSEQIIWSEELIEPREKVTWSLFDRDDPLNKILKDLDSLLIH